jgi:beta-phosphoglucomutase family hydrolase
MGWEAAIFDMDGVVVDTVPIHYAAWKRMAADFGRELSFDDYKSKVDGIPRIDGARAILDGLEPHSIETAAERKQEYFLAALSAEEIPIYRSTLALMERLRTREVGVAVISSSKNAPLILRRIGIWDQLDAVVSGDDVIRGKPDPQIFLTAAEKLGKHARSCIVFEDAVLGVVAAKRAGMLCVGIDRYGKPERLGDADVVVADVGDVDEEQLRRLANRHA